MKKRREEYEAARARLKDALESIGVAVYELDDPRHPTYRERMLERADELKKARGENGT